MNITSLEVLKGLVAKKSLDTPQPIQVSVTTDDILSNMAEIKWYHMHANGCVDDLFASATLFYGDSTEWLASWIPMIHLVQGRIQDLERLADLGVANRFTKNMAYLLFANNLVDYATKYRGMQSVVLHGFEAFADVVLSTEKGGVWTVPPYFIDSVAHLAGFIMNVSDEMDTKSNFCVTPGWESMRFAKPLVAGAKYRSYVKMIPTAEDPSVYLGDVYILQDDIIIGMVGGIMFRRYPRILLSRFFSAPDDNKAPPVASASSSKSTPVKPASTQASLKHVPVAAPVPETIVKAAASASSAEITKEFEAAANSVADSDSIAAKAFQIIADEAALELSDLIDDASIAGLGVDSLMGLVIAEKFREQLGIAVSGSLFLEFLTIKQLRNWLEDYYN